MKVLPQVTVPYVRLLYNFWIEQGVPQDVLDDLLKVNLAEDDLVDFSLSSDQLFKLHKAAIAYTQDTSLGIKLGLHLADKNLVISKLVLTAPTLQDSVQALITYSSLISESGYFQYLPQFNHHQPATEYTLSFVAHSGNSISSYQLDMVFAVVIAWFKHILPNNSAELIYHSSVEELNSPKYSDLLGCEVKAAKDTYLLIPEKLLQHKNVLSCFNTHQQELKKLQRLLKRRQENLVWYKKVQTAVENCLNNSSCLTNQECVADSLNLSVRNMQRKLKKLGINYQTILDEQRKTLALKLLQENTATLSEISDIVGFTEPSAFYKAFRRWTGKRPGQYRPDSDG